MNFYRCRFKADKEVLSETFEICKLLILQAAKINLCVTTNFKDFLALESLHELL